MKNKFGLDKICVFIQNLEMVIAGFIVLSLVSSFIFGMKAAIILTGSMEPKIPTHSVVFVDTHTQVNEINVGDIIAFRVNDDTTVTHRVIEIDNNLNEFITKGDANETEDLAPVPFDNFMGKTELVIPYVGGIILELKGSKGIILLAGIIIFNLLLDYIIKTSSKIKKEELTNIEQ